MTEDQKRWLISSGITFVTSFLGTFALLASSQVTADNLSTSLIVSLALTALRAAVKAVVEMGIESWKLKKANKPIDS